VISVSVCCPDMEAEPLQPYSPNSPTTIRQPIIRFFCISCSFLLCNYFHQLQNAPVTPAQKYRFHA
jgi:hypothetical protein